MEILLARFGSDVVNQHIDLRRLADCIVNIYVMTACLGKYCNSVVVAIKIKKKK